MIADTTESEEMYLIHVVMAGEQGTEGAVPLRVLADMLTVTPVSANQMVRKLVSRGLVDYTPYHGVELTGEGRRIASRVLRVRRLWSVFLTDRLGLSALDADRVACDLEHITPTDVGDRLATLLGDPTTGPSGRPIPARDGSVPPAPRISLADLPVGAAGIIESATEAVGSFLSASGAAVGDPVTVLATAENGDRLVEAAGGELHLTAAVAETIKVRQELQ